MSTTVEEVVEQIKALTPEQQEMVRELASLLATTFAAGKMMEILEKALTLTPDDMRRLRDVLNTVTWEMSGPDVRRRLARGVRGKYANLPTSSEAFSSLKAGEIALENRRSRT
ncbi:MAG: hypothetical protein LC800_01860 [Acidobacteria bacterium]|nr:hypothetical protein [Acidobacteriota bacterium]